MKLSVGESLNNEVILEVNIDPALNKVAVLFSGGMDSTLVLYMLLKEKFEKNLNTEIHCFTTPQTGRYYHSANVLALAEFKDKCIHHQNFENAASEGIRPMVLNLLSQGWVVYSGANANPLEEIGGRYPERKYYDPLPITLFVPFRYFFKYHILDAYRKLNIEHIARITHSCTEQQNNICGECFACRERAWAFKKLEMLEV